MADSGFDGPVEVISQFYCLSEVVCTSGYDFEVQCFALKTETLSPVLRQKSPSCTISSSWPAATDQMADTILGRAARDSSLSSFCLLVHVFHPNHQQVVCFIELLGSTFGDVCIQSGGKLAIDVAHGSHEFIVGERMHDPIARTFASSSRRTWLFIVALKYRRPEPPTAWCDCVVGSID